MYRWAPGTEARHVCLRLGDVIEYVDGNRWRVTRSWQKPGAVQFDRMLYGEPINK